MSPLLLPLLFGTLLAPFAAQALAPNELEITVGGPKARANYLFVTVRICEPGSDRCQTIPNIQLDSGSTGLRIFASALKLNLGRSKGPGGASIAECKIFGGGESLWGSVAKADVILGEERARNVPVQLIDKNFAAAPTSCEEPVEIWSHGNGILGMGPALSDCGGAACDPTHYLGARYYECAPDAACKELPLNLGEQVQNPVALLDSDGNGSIVRMPPTPPTREGEALYRGTLVLGIGTAPNNQPASGVKTFLAEHMGWLPVFLETRYWAKIDTGAAFWSFPSGKSGLPHCNGKDLDAYLCPAGAVEIAAQVGSLDGTTTADIKIPLRNAAEALSADKERLLVPGVAYEFGGLTSEVMILGLPFFFGRDVYLGIDQRESVLGKGAYYAF